MDVPWKRAVVIGASSGIGEQIARQLVHEGVQVALVARRRPVLESIAAELNSGSGELRARVYGHDVREVECVPALFQQICADLGGLDLIVYSAGVMPRLQPEQYDFASDRLTIETNVTGAVAWLNEAAQRFERARSGTIVGISSVAGDRGRRGGPVYSASKAALNTYLEGLRNRIGRSGVRVVTIKPGPVDTPMTKGLDRLPMLISPAKAAELTVKAARRGAGTAYVPGAWRPIMAILCGIPSFFFKRLNV